MMNQFGHGWGMGFGWLFGLILLIIIVVFIVRATQSQKTNESSQTPLDILKERYARGEINKEEFEERRQNLDK
jgi:putative membrane protein